MTIVRREHRAQFTIVPNAIFRDDQLSIEAKGVLGYSGRCGEGTGGRSCCL
jgi:hypothetical protein